MGLAYSAAGKQPQHQLVTCAGVCTLMPRRGRVIMPSDDFRGSSPYAAKRGRRPQGPGLPGQEGFLRGFSHHLREVSRGGIPEHVVLTGPTGCGKTSLLEACVEVARSLRYEVVELSRDSTFKTALSKKAGGRASWFKRLQPSVGAGVGLPGGVTANISAGLTRQETEILVEDLAAQLSRAARSRSRGGKRGGFLLTVDEMHRFPPEDLLVLQEVLHRLKPDRNGEIPIVLLGTGHPGIREIMPVATGNPITYSAMKIPLTRQAVEEALRAPAIARGRDWSQEAISITYQLTQGHPGFTQILANHTWLNSPNPLINAIDVQQSTTIAHEYFTAEYLMPQWQQLNLLQRDYVSVLAIHSGISNDGQIASALKAPLAEVMTVGEQLRRAGMVMHRTDGNVQICDYHLSQLTSSSYPYLAGQRRIAGLAPLEHQQASPRGTQPDRQPALIHELSRRAAQLASKTPKDHKTPDRNTERGR